MVKLKMKSLSPSKSSPSLRKARRKVKVEGNRKVKPEEDLLLPIDETKKADVKSSQIRVPSDFTKRRRPSSLTTVIAALSEEKKEAVRQIGFGGLLHLKLTSFSMTMFSQLLFAFRSVEYFEVSETEKFRLTEDDICDVFGLPNGGHDLELLVTGLASSSSSDGESLNSLWRERYNIISSKDPISLSAVKTKLLSNGLTDEEFKQTFVLFAMSSFLAPASGAVVDLRLLSAVEDVSRIHQLNWCKYVLEELVIGVREAVRGAKYVRGFIVLLAIVYFHRYIKRGSKLSNELPLIQHWNDHKFGDRLNREEAAGGLGHSDRSEVVFPISRRKHSNKSGEASSLPNNHVGNVCHIVVDLHADIRTDEEVHSSSIDDVHELLLLNERDSELFCKRYMDRMNLIKLKMQARSEQSSLKESSQVSPSAGSRETRTVDGVGTKQRVATPSFFTSQVIKKVDEYVNEILTMRESRVIHPIVPIKAKDVIIQPPSFDLFSQFYEDCVKLSDVEKDSVEKDKAPQSPLIQDYVKEHTIEESPISLEDILSNVFSDVEAHEKEVYDEGGHVEDGKEDTNAGGKVDGKEVEKDDIVVEDYLVDVGGGNDLFDVGAEKVKDDKERKTQKTQEQDSDDLFVIAEDAEAVMAESADLLINAATTGDVVLEDNKDFRSSYLLHSELDEGLMSVVPKTFGCSIDCGEVDEQMVVLSKTMISAKHVFNPMRSLRKQAADYCFLDDCDIPLSDNIVLWGTRSYLTKEDMETMIPDKMIMVGVIEWWSLFLNDTCITVDLRKLFFGLAQMQPLVRICSPTNDEKTPKIVLVDEVKSAFLTCTRNNKKQCDLISDLIFIPLHLGDHSSCLCINFTKRKVEYLDNVYKKLLFYGKDSEIGLYCHTVLNIMSEFLVENGVPGGAESPSVSGAKSTVTSTVEASASVSTPPAGPVSIKGDNPKSLKSVLGSRKRGMADDGLDAQVAEASGGPVFPG
ncbi:hypothetical protein KSS87_017190 [Heliosperma pusillum]|nr:hypothetical protein KSS87_017190 [Heliosperma pusillum]